MQEVGEWGVSDKRGEIDDGELWDEPDECNGDEKTVGLKVVALHFWEVWEEGLPKAGQWVKAEHVCMWWPKMKNLNVLIRYGI